MKEKKETSVKELQSFGLILAAALLIVAFWPVIKPALGFVFWKILVKRWWAWCPAVIILFIAWVFPKHLEPLYHAWLTLGAWLGWLNTRILLGIVFFLLFTPIGFVMRLFGYDPLNLSLQRNSDSYRIPAQSMPRNHMERQF